MKESNENSGYTLRVWFNGEDYQECSVMLSPSAPLAGQSVMVYGKELPKFIADPMALLKMVGPGEKIDGVGAHKDEHTFYVDVKTEDWDQYKADKIVHSTLID